MCDRPIMGVGRTGKKNAPSFIYEILYGEPRFLPGKTEIHGQKIWKGIPVDEHIPVRALDGLDSIEEIELRASCEGSGPDRPTFLIFRFRTDADKEEITNFVAGMNAIEDVKCGAERGNMGFYRVGVTAPLWHGKNSHDFERWWLELPVKIRVVLSVIETVAV